MDRLIVGDVGFGKTEVAMRAAMRVALEGRQVAVLCPTTVLAFQHHQSFVERFDGFGVRVELLSSFRSTAELKALRKEVAAGEVDVVIGTQSLLGRSLRFGDLGLVIVDEEHRFGVKQKEKLKKLAQSWSSVPVDFLAMSATPIPRSWLSGLRKVSLITTPPAGRRSVQTRVMRWSDARIRDEILHELRRGGQVFFIHNRVQSIERVARRLRELVPEAEFAVAHGQMEDSDLERTLVRFVRREFHVLVCTTIVESGVDIPSMNTILINRADQLGLAQLYQLRGRVGGAPSGARACCSRDAADEKKASSACVAQEHELGAGFAIASATSDPRRRRPGREPAREHPGGGPGHRAAGGGGRTARGDLGRERFDPDIEVPVPALLPNLHRGRPGAPWRVPASRPAGRSGRSATSSRPGGHWRAPPEVLNLGWQAEARVRARKLGLERVAWLKVWSSSTSRHGPRSTSRRWSPGASVACRQGGTASRSASTTTRPSTSTASCIGSSVAWEGVGRGRAGAAAAAPARVEVGCPLPARADAPPRPAGARGRRQRPPWSDGAAPGRQPQEALTAGPGRRPHGRLGLACTGPMADTESSTGSGCSPSRSRQRPRAAAAARAQAIIQHRLQSILDRERAEETCRRAWTRAAISPWRPRRIRKWRPFLAARLAELNGCVHRGRARSQKLLLAGHPDDRAGCWRSGAGWSTASDLGATHGPGRTGAMPASARLRPSPRGWPRPGRGPGRTGATRWSGSSRRPPAGRARLCPGAAAPPAGPRAAGGRGRLRPRAVAGRDVEV